MGEEVPARLREIRERAEFIREDASYNQAVRARALMNDLPWLLDLIEPYFDGRIVHVASDYYDALEARVRALMGERDELAARVVSLEETLTAESRRLQQVAEDRNALAALLEDVANEASHPEVLADRARAILDRSTPE